MLNSSDTEPEQLTSAEQAAVDRLIATRRQLIMEGSRVDTKSDHGSATCGAHLEALDAAASTLRLDKAPRTYRETFTINYRALFPNHCRNYRVDVLEAGFEQYATIWVNGDKFEFSAEAVRRAKTLQHSWWELGTVLEGWYQASVESTEEIPNRMELRTALVALDFAWASFEHKYISELIEIEEKARRLIVRAIEHERVVAKMEMHRNFSLDETKNTEIDLYRQAQRKLVGSISHLNSVANVRRKGRDDLAVEVLVVATATLSRCDQAEKNGTPPDSLLAARILATDVVDSFQAMRDYLKEVAHCLERVDPHLCNNVGLVARLVDWEESWEMGTRYMQDEKVLHVICDLVAEIRRAQEVVPALTGMCEECDVELFMVLPRIIWIRFLAEPKNHAYFLQSLLPHRFNNSTQDSWLGLWSTTHAWDGQLQQLVKEYERILTLIDAHMDGETSSRRYAWECLVQLAISGTVEKGGANTKLIAAVREPIAELMRMIEPLSIELQRHCPEDWNQCSAILVQCLTGSAGREKSAAPFRA